MGGIMHGVVAYHTGGGLTDFNRSIQTSFVLTMVSAAIGTMCFVQTGILNKIYDEPS